MEKIVLSGGSGFIGKHLTKMLKKNGFEVFPIPQNLLYAKFLLKDFIKEKKPGKIFILHAYGNMFNQQDEDKIINANYTATWNLLKATQDISYKSLVYVSTSSVLLPYQTFYSATKMGMEYLLQAYTKKYDKPVAIVRPFTVYGEGEADFRFIPTVFRSCLTGEAMTLSNGTHDYVYVSDFTKFLINISDVIGLPDIGTIHDFGGGKAIINEEVVFLIEKITGKKAHITERKELRPYDNNKWYAKYPHKNLISLEEGLQKVYKYYREKYDKK